MNEDFYDHDPVTGRLRRPRSRSRRLLFATAGLGSVAAVTSAIEVRMPLSIPLFAFAIGVLGLVSDAQARARIRRAEAREDAPLVIPFGGFDGDLRIGDAERDQVTAALHDHFAAGRLTRTELDERLADALSAKTCAELAPLLADLPERGRPR